MASLRSLTFASAIRAAHRINRKRLPLSKHQQERDREWEAYRQQRQQECLEAWVAQRLQ
jgi:hypothetical protein